MTGLQQICGHSNPQPQLFSAPQQLPLDSNPACAVLAIPIRATIAVNALIHFMEQHLLPLGLKLFVTLSKIAPVRVISSATVFRVVVWNSAACDARRTHVAGFKPQS